jgi:hypothetical protein
MVNFYVYRITNGKMKLENVPTKWREKVAEKLSSK